PCGPGWSAWCTVNLPLVNGTNWTAPCGRISGPISVPERILVQGIYTEGTGGNVSVFDDPACGAGNRTASIAVTSTTVNVFRDPSVAITDGNGGSGDVNESVQFFATARFGAPPLAYAWSGLPSGCLSVDLAEVDCSPTTAGAVTVQVAVTDAAGTTVTAKEAYTVDPDPIFFLRASATQVDVGLNLTFLAVGALGSGFYDFAWAGLPPGCLPVNASAQQCVVTTPGLYDVVLSGNDSAGTPAVAPIVEVDVAPALSVSITSFPTAPIAGRPLVLNATASGGFGPDTFTWTGLSASCTGADEAQVHCTLAPGAYRFEVTVRDTVGGASSANWSVTVPAESSSPSLSSGILIGGIIGVVALIGIGLAAWWRRGRRRGQKTP
ncbi:MAG TPA: hypothetical protein VMH90_02485, partial [Thermoplasmata archaeon]|nr:hypothetical protein [Thermoplasmata archaeon]